MRIKIIRQRIIGIVLIVSMVVSCFVLVNVADLAGKIMRERSHVKMYSHTMRAVIGYDYYSEEDEFIHKDVVEYLCDCDCGNVFVETLVTVGNERKEYILTIIMAKNLDIPGANYCEEILDSTNGVLIGENLKGFVKDGKIVLGNSEVVVKVMDNVMSSGIDNRFYILYNNCNYELKEYLHNRMNFMMDVVMYGDERIENQFKEFTSYARDNKYSCHECAPEDIGGFENKWYKYTNEIILAVSLLFAVINVYIVSDLWLKSRSREIAIRKAYGYSESMIFGLLYRDTLLHSSVAMVIAFVVQFMYKFIFEKMFLDIITAIEIAGVFVGMLIIAFVNVMRLQKQIRNIEPARFLARRER